MEVAGASMEASVFHLRLLLHLAEEAPMAGQSRYCSQVPDQVADDHQAVCSAEVLQAPPEAQEV